MSDSIGVLGSASTVTTGTTTAYTVGASKASKVKIMYRSQAGAGGTSTLTVTINGIVIFEKGATTASHYIYSTPSAAMITGSAAPTGASDATTCGPAPTEYYLSTGDTVQYTLGGEDFAAMNFQVVGVEVDV